jgi:ABC-2 type transport system permease protein
MGLNAVFYREAKIRFTNLVWIFWDLFYPLGYMLVFGVAVSHSMPLPIGGAAVEYNAFFLAGVLGMASFGIASNSAWGFFVDRDNGIFYEMLTYPVSRARYLVGKVLFNVLLCVLQATITVGLAWLVLGVPIQLRLLPWVVVGVVGGTIGWFFFYTIFAMRIRRNDLFNTVNSVFYFVFLFASSMFYPLDPLPSWLRSAALANPITWQVDLLRYGTIGLGDPLEILIEASAFGLFAAGTFLIAVHTLRDQ